MSDEGFVIPEIEVKPTKEEKEKKGKDPLFLQTLGDDFIFDNAKAGVRFRYHAERMLRYDGKRYTHEQQVEHLIRKWLLDKSVPHNNNMIGNLVSHLKTRTLSKLDKHPNLPFWASEAPPCEPRNVLAFNNGLLDVKSTLDGTPKLMPHTREWVSTTCLPHDYDSTAECPNWLNFLSETFEGDWERADLLQEWFGYLLCEDNTFQKMLILRGVSRAGKGTITTVLQSVLGQDACIGFALDTMATQFGLSSLVGKLVALVGEVNLQGHRDKYRIFQNLNSITGNDPVGIEFKYNAIMPSLTLPTRFVISCNSLPTFHDDSGALSERVSIIDFERAVPPEKRIPNLAETLIGEASGITNWALKGLKRLREHGRFSTPNKSAESLNNYRRENSQTLAFLQDHVRVHRDIDTGNLPGVEIVDGAERFTHCATLATRYTEWAIKNDLPQKDPRYIQVNLTKILPKMKKFERLNDRKERKRAYIGLELK